MGASSATPPCTPSATPRAVLARSLIGPFISVLTCVNVGLRCRVPIMRPPMFLCAPVRRVRVRSVVGSGWGHTVSALATAIGPLGYRVGRMSRRSCASRTTPSLRAFWPLASDMFASALYALAIQSGELPYEVAARMALWPGTVTGVLYEESTS
jgi:hypothetical protein